MFDKYYEGVVNKRLWACRRQSTFSSLCLSTKALVRVVEGAEQQEKRGEWKGHFRPRATDWVPGRTEKTLRTTPIFWTWQSRSTLINTNTNSNDNNNSNKEKAFGGRKMMCSHPDGPWTKHLLSYIQLNFCLGWSSAPRDYVSLGSYLLFIHLGFHVRWSFWHCFLLFW